VSSLFSDSPSPHQRPPLPSSSSPVMMIEEEKETPKNKNEKVLTFAEFFQNTL